MPEMPEVETIVRRLRARIVGRRIVRAGVSGFPLRRPLDGNIAERLCGHTVRRISRRGKYIVAELEPKAFWVIHLGMSGRILYHPEPHEVSRHTHVSVQFSDGSELEYRDPRRFGFVCLYESPQMSRIPGIAALGKDPLDRGFDGAWLAALLEKSRQEIKPFLLDQRKVSGLGNIYVCESLFRAGLHPRRRCFTITREEARGLADAIRDVVRAAIRCRGTSFSDFVDSDGMAGGYQKRLRVFQREGKSCFRCGNTIRRLNQGNRSSYYCPVCQKLGGGSE